MWDTACAVYTTDETQTIHLYKQSRMRCEDRICSLRIANQNMLLVIFLLVTCRASGHEHTEVLGALGWPWVLKNVGCAKHRIFNFLF